MDSVSSGVSGVSVRDRRFILDLTSTLRRGFNPVFVFNINT